jgi:hypothetical protein
LRKLSEVANLCDKEKQSGAVLQAANLVSRFCDAKDLLSVSKLHNMRIMRAGTELLGRDCKDFEATTESRWVRVQAGAVQCKTGRGYLVGLDGGSQIIIIYPPPAPPYATFNKMLRACGGPWRLVDKRTWTKQGRTVDDLEKLVKGNGTGGFLLCPVEQIWPFRTVSQLLKFWNECV